MPRGYLKRKASSVGRKQARGGASKPKSLRVQKWGYDHESANSPKYWVKNRAGKTPAIRRYCQQLLREALDGDWFSVNDDYYYDECEFESTHDVEETLTEESDHQTIPPEEGNSVEKEDFQECLVEKFEEGGSLVEIASAQESFGAEDIDGFSFCEDQTLSSFSFIDNVSLSHGSCNSSFSMVECEEAFASLNLSAKALLVSQSKCYICQTEKTLFKLIRKCCHPLACFDCLRQRYIIEAQQDIQNFPLKCFFPHCRRVLRDTQVRLLARNTREIKEHFRLQKSAKTLRRRYQSLHKCPSCDGDTHVPILGPGGSMEVICGHCNSNFAARRLPTSEAANVVLGLGGTPVAKCPACSFFVEKHGGCDDITCFCGHEFSFSKEKFRFSFDGKEVLPLYEARKYFVNEVAAVHSRAPLRVLYR